MTEAEFRRGRAPDIGQPGDDLRHRLELVDEALLAISGNVAAGHTPRDELERDRCRRVGERIAAEGRRVVDLLARPPSPDLEACVLAAQDRVLDEARDREQGEEP